MKQAELTKAVSSLATLLLLVGYSSTGRADTEFNPALLEKRSGANTKVDLAAFEKGSQGPGTYHVDILVNGQIQETRDVKFAEKSNQDASQSLVPCLTANDLRRYGINVDAFPGLKYQTHCVDITVIPQASATLQFNTQQLLLSIPQAALLESVRGAINPREWDEGINSFLLNYSYSGANEDARKNGLGDNSYHYINLRPSLNIGAWRLRNYTTWNHSQSAGSKWNTVYTYLQRNIATLGSQLTLGESHSPSDVFDSVAFRGVQLASDDEMLPDSLKGYAPVVRGIARTNAQVIIRQNGYIIYQSYVAPGAFAISDMYPTGGSGDLHVTIKEADGTEQNIVVPFASVPVLQREGRFKYSVTGGSYRSYRNNSNSDPFSQATGIYGLSHGFTVYGGSQLAKRYHSVTSGVGKNLGDLGALSVDFSHAWSKLKDEGTQKGQSWRVRYSKNFVATGTNFAIAGYRYSTRGYYTLNEVMSTWQEDPSYLNRRRRSRVEFTMNQSLWENAGAISVGLVSENYWNNAQRMRSLNIGYNNSWNGINYSLNYSDNRNSSQSSTNDGQHYKTYNKDQVLAFNINIPFRQMPGDAMANYSVTNTRHGNTSHTLGASGTALAGRNLNWNVQEGYTTQNVGANGNVNADYKGTYGEVNGGYAWDRNTRRTNYGVAGAMLLHEDGLTLSQPLGETVALVKAPGIAGAAVQNEVGVKTDFRGYTAVPYLSAYRRSEITLDTETLPEDVDVEIATRKVVPTRGAVVLADFKGHVGQRALVTLRRTNGEPVPFGAVAVLEQPEESASKASWSSIVGDNGEVYLSGMQPDGNIKVTWGRSSRLYCIAHYHISDVDKYSVQQATAVCK